MSHSPPRLTFGAVLLLLLTSFTSNAQDPMDPWKDFDFAKTPLNATKVQSLPLEDLKLLRGFIFGRHGRVFKDAEIKMYLEAQSWFKPNPDFKNSMLNETDR